ncbi:hypothetical protein OAE79_02740 [Rhodopirellula sp.]|nr:hypothetical protein [Rhodopirellula sp.]MDB4679235.1 hypothetical protein [Rhodopirellula sp.]
MSTNQVLETQPPAKLNLFLELLGKRDDGYHEIDTLMVPINWCDRLVLQRTKSPSIRFKVLQPDFDGVPTQSVTPLPPEPTAANNQPKVEKVPANEGNLVHQALQAFRRHFKISDGFDCLLEKKIPAGAGMGGASSDAASALLLASQLHDLPIRSTVLHQLAAKLGSDVPFFLGSPNTIEPINSSQNCQQKTCFAMRATGRGEKLEVVDCPKKLHFVVIFPGIGLSTPAVFSCCKVPEQPREIAPFLDALQRGDLETAPRFMANRLTEPAKKLAPGITTTLESLKSVGLQHSQLTGSGSACFGIAESEAVAKDCSERLKQITGAGCTIQTAQSVEVPVLAN